MKKIADWLFDLNPVMIGMFAIIGYLFLETVSLLYDVLPPSVTVVWMRWALAIFLSCAFHLTVLNISTNQKIIHPVFAVIMALLGVLITGFFFDAFSWQDKTMQQILLACLFSVIVGFCGYTYVFLFVEKYKQHQTGLSRQQQINELERIRAELVEDNRNLGRKVGLLTAQVDKLTGNSDPIGAESGRNQPGIRANSGLFLARNTGQNGAGSGQNSDRKRADSGPRSAPKRTKSAGKSAPIQCELCQTKFADRKKFSNRRLYCKKKPEQCRGHFKPGQSAENQPP